MTGQCAGNITVNIPPSVCTGLIGDVNGDGVVNITDELFVAQAMSGIRTLTSCQLRLADINGDGHVDSVDQMFLAQYRVGLLTNAIALSRIGKPIPLSDLNKPVPVLW